MHTLSAGVEPHLTSDYLYDTPTSSTDGPGR